VPLLKFFLWLLRKFEDKKKISGASPLYNVTKARTRDCYFNPTAFVVVDAICDTLDRRWMASFLLLSSVKGALVLQKLGYKFF
jgi:hypothetical protein